MNFTRLTADFHINVYLLSENFFEICKVKKGNIDRFDFIPVNDKRPVRWFGTLEFKNSAAI